MELKVGERVNNARRMANIDHFSIRRSHVQGQRRSDLATLKKKSSCRVFKMALLEVNELVANSRSPSQF